MGVAWRRVAVLVLLLTLALPAFVFGKGGEGGPILETQTTCWPCHVSWNAAPLKTFYQILPPPEAGAPVGEPFQFIVQLQNAWVPPGDGPYILYYEPALNLTAAPSLAFHVDTPPFEESLAGETPANPQGEARAFVTTNIPVGATSASVVLTPAQPDALTGPDFVMNIYGGVTEPTGTPTVVRDEGGRGQPESLTIDGKAQFGELGLGYGNWTIEVVAKAPNPDTANPLAALGPPNLQAHAFTVDVAAQVLDTGERIQKQPTSARVPKGGSILFTYDLISNGPPAPGEDVGLVVNATVYYKHKDGSTDDYANITKALSSRIPVTFEDPRVLLRSEIDNTRLAPANGATIDTLSEAIGYGASFLLVSSVWTGGMFGKASRRQLNSVFGSAKRRVAFHNFLSYGLMLFAAVHTVLFIIELAYHWTLGLIWGGAALLAMTGLGVTGAFQVQMIRRWNYGVWRWSHYSLAVAAILFTLVHLALDGVHFGFVQEAIGWDDPLDTRNTG